MLFFKLYIVLYNYLLENINKKLTLLCKNHFIHLALFLIVQKITKTTILIGIIINVEEERKFVMKISLFVVINAIRDTFFLTGFLVVDNMIFKKVQIKDGFLHLELWDNKKEILLRLEKL